MGLMNTVKAKIAPAKGKVSDLAHQHGGRITHGLDKAAEVVDKRTKGKYRDKIHTGTGKAKSAMNRLAHKDARQGPGGSTPPASPPPAS